MLGPRQVTGFPSPPDPSTHFEELAARIGRAEAGQRLLIGTLPPAGPDAISCLTPPVMFSTEELTPAAYLPLITRHVTALPLYERRALWVTRYDWTSIYQTPLSTTLETVVSNAAGAGFNTLFFQVRAAGDVYYASDLEPWAARLTGTLTETLGQDPGWDPLACLVTLAHAANLEVHAYVYVYPAWLGADAPPENINPPHVFWTWSHQYGWADWRQWHRTNGAMNLSSGYLWASPGVDGVRDHVVDVVHELAQGYELDGVHLDLVRYAGPDYSYDPFSNAHAGVEPTSARADWQRERVTALVRQIYTDTTSLNPELWLSAAVWPYYQDQWGWGISEGYHDLYQDSKGWLEEGALDAIVPMLYGGMADDFANWQLLLADFMAASAGRHIYPGIGAFYDDFVEIEQRIEAARSAGAPGHAIFSYTALEQRGYWDDLASGPYAQPALVPERGVAPP